jgi:hypothetical protein
MSTTLFRALVLISVAASFVGNFVDIVFPSLIPAPLTDALENALESNMFAGNVWLMLCLAVPLVGASIAGVIGLILFRAWARTVSILVLCIGIVVTPFFGPTLSSGLASAFIELSVTLWGAVLAIAYFSPISQRFLEREQSGQEGSSVRSEESDSA